MRPYLPALLISLSCLTATAAAAQEVLKTATPDLLIRSLDPVTKEKTRGLKVTTARDFVNSYGDTLTATVNLAVTFQFGSATLTPQAESLLDSVGKALQAQELKPYRFLIGGHTDAIGTDEENMQLSRARAASATNYLISRYNIEPRRLVVRAFGETALLIPTDPEDGRNRRVEISTLK